MTEDRIKRRLRAIFSADVAGYSRLMGKDEIATVASVKALREIVADRVRRFDGRVVDTAGDSMLAEFSSAVNAVECALNVQQRIAAYNESMPPERQMRFRIGINLGEVIFDEDRIYGDGVNIAARIEALAEPGGVSISSSIRDQVKKKLDLVCDDQGTHAVKHIDEPVHVFRLLAKSEGEHLPPPRPSAARFGNAMRIGMALALLAAIGGVVWHHNRGDAPSGHHAPIEDETPAIAVVPFANLGADDRDDYFIDGITSDIITDLSRFKELLVIAANTMFTYKGKPVQATELQDELKVRYILEGSVQKSGERVRVNAQLIDAATGYHLWADRYDRRLEDVFAVQDELVHTIVGRLAIRIGDIERQRAEGKPARNLKAYDYLLQGREHYFRDTRADTAAARELYQKAIAIDPDDAAAYTAIAQTYMWEFLYGTLFPEQTLERVDRYARRALALDETDARAHTLVGYVLFRRGQFDVAIAKMRRALELNPNDAEAQNRIGTALLYAGEIDEAIYWKESYLRIDPRPQRGELMTLALAYFLNDRHADAIAVLNRGISDDPDYVGYHITMAAVAGDLGRIDEARQAARQVRRLDPFFDVSQYGTAFKRAGDRKQIQAGLRKAGLD